MSLTGFGARSLVPDEALEGYAEDAALPEGWLIRPGFPMRATAVRDPGFPSPAVVQLHVGDTAFGQERRRLIWQAAYDAVIGGIGRAGVDTPSPNPQFVFRWRLTASGDPWTEVPGQTLAVSLQSSDSRVTEGTRVLDRVIIQDRRLTPSFTEYDPTAPDLPADFDDIEFFLIGPIPPDELHPIIVEGITAGQFCVNAYAGLYSARDLTGAVVPTGIRYDEPAFAQMTDLVRLRLDEPIEDLRDWLEKHIYAPTGWVPALDNQGRISPVSQIAPQDTDALDVIADAITEPSPDWDAGQRIVNIVRFKYNRDYIVGKPDPAPSTLQVVRQNMLKAREIVLEFRDELSVARHGEQVVEYDGLAFAAIGRDATVLEEASVDPSTLPVYEGMITKLMTREKFDAWVAPYTETPTVRSARLILPVSGDIAEEKGWQLAQLRDLHVGNRYVYGAQAIRIAIMRAAEPDLRVGDWRMLNLSWLPDYITQRRALLHPAQVISIGDLDCAWRQLLVELVTPVAES